MGLEICTFRKTIRKRVDCIVGRVSFTLLRAKSSRKRRVISFMTIGIRSSLRNSVWM